MTWRTLAGKELTSWLSACAVFSLVQFWLFVFLSGVVSAEVYEIWLYRFLIIAFSSTLFYKYGIIFQCSRTSNSEVENRNWPKFNLVWDDFMPVLVTYKFSENPIKMKASSCAQHFLHYNYMGKIDAHGRVSWCSRAGYRTWLCQFLIIAYLFTPQANISIRSEIELIRDFMPVLVTCKFD